MVAPTFFEQSARGGWQIVPFWLTDCLYQQCLGLPWGSIAVAKGTWVFCYTRTFSGLAPIVQNGF
jgi:hypothetical protein